MPTHDELGEGLINCLKDISSLLERAYKIAMQERDALVKNDPKAVTRCCGAQDEIMRRISEADQRTAGLAAELAQKCGTDASAMTAAGVTELAGHPYNKLIKSELATIANASKKVATVNEINRKLLENGLSIVACCLRTLACNNKPSSYSKEAALSAAGAATLSLDRKV